MSDFSIKVTGNKEVASALDKGVEKLSDKIKTLAVKVEGRVKKATVVDTGELRSSVVHELGGNWARIGSNIEYASFIEYGTSKMEARHMEGGSKVLGQGMMGYTLETMRDDLKDFEVDIVKNVEGRF